MLSMAMHVYGASGYFTYSTSCKVFFEIEGCYDEALPSCIVIPTETLTTSETPTEHPSETPVEIPMETPTETPMDYKNDFEESLEEVNPGESEQGHVEESCDVPEQTNTDSYREPGETEGAEETEVPEVIVKSVQTDGSEDYGEIEETRNAVDNDETQQTDVINSPVSVV